MEDIEVYDYTNTRERIYRTYSSLMGDIELDITYDISLEDDVIGCMPPAGSQEIEYWKWIGRILDIDSGYRDVTIKDENGIYYDNDDLKEIVKHATKED